MKHSVLLIEDNDTNRHLATFLLERAGCTVHHAANGARGLELAAHLRPDLVVLDIQMPEMDGYEVATRLRAAPDFARTPILVVTSYAQVGDRQRALALGVDDYIEKPFEPEVFIARVNSLLSGRALP